MEGDLESQLSARTRRLERWERAWVRGPATPEYRALVWAWALACLARLTLLEPEHGVWWAATLVLLVGAAGLARWGGRVWWALCLVGLAWPYFFLRDWMTQSLVMGLVAVAGFATASADDDGARVRRTAHLLVALTYFVAVFHKLNRDFFDPELGCAAYGWAKLQAFAGLDPAPLGQAGGVAVAAAVVGTELLIGALLLARPRAAAVVGLLFHVPLTIVLAPAFVFVMAVGYVAALRPEHLEALRPTRRGATLVGSSAVAAAAIGGTPDDAILGAKIAIVLLAAVALALAGCDRGAPGRVESAAARDLRGRARRAGALPTALCALFAVNALTPYLGTQFQHTGAMLSNLRIDPGCWNHLLVPESVRRVDPYLRIDHATIGPAAAHPVLDERPFAEREATLVETLWSPSALRRIRRNWCREHTRPIAIRGTYRGAGFAIEDLCDPDAPLPRGVGLFGGDEWLPDFLKLQKNLPRACPAACIH